MAAIRIFPSQCMKLLFGGIVVCFVIVCLHQSTPVQSQFFTKTSKSIPRMGRRSDPRQDILPGEPSSSSSFVMTPTTAGSDSDLDNNGNRPSALGYNGNNNFEIFRRTGYTADMPEAASLIFDEVTSGSMIGGADSNHNSIKSRLEQQKSNNNLYGSTNTNQRKSSEPSSRDRLAMRALYLGRLSQQLNSGQQFLSVPQMMGGLTRSRLTRSSNLPSSTATMRQVSDSNSGIVDDLIGMIPQPPIIIHADSSSLARK